MAGEYSALRVGVSADTSEMERQIARSASTSGEQASRSMGDKLKSGLGAAATGVAKVMATGFTVAMGGATALTAATIGSGIAYNALYQRSSAAFKTILGSQEAARDMMKQISEFAKTSPFPVRRSSKPRSRCSDSASSRRTSSRTSTPYRTPWQRRAGASKTSLS